MAKVQRSFLRATLSLMVLALATPATAQEIGQIHTSAESAFSAGVLDLCMPIFLRATTSTPDSPDRLQAIEAIYGEAGWTLGSGQPMELIVALGVPGGANPGEAQLAEGVNGDVISSVGARFPSCRIAAIGIPNAASELLTTLTDPASGWVELSVPAGFDGVRLFGLSQPTLPTDFAVTIVPQLNGPNRFGLSATAEVLPLEKGRIERDRLSNYPTQ